MSCTPYPVAHLTQMGLSYFDKWLHAPDWSVSLALTWRGYVCDRYLISRRGYVMQHTHTHTVERERKRAVTSIRWLNQFPSAPVPSDTSQINDRDHHPCKTTQKRRLLIYRCRWEKNNNPIRVILDVGNNNKKNNNKKNIALCGKARSYTIW